MEVKGRKNILHANENQKKAGVGIFTKYIADKIHFKTKTIIGDKVIK